MNALRRLTTALVTAALTGGLAGPALAADSVTVDAEVSAAAPCLISSTSSLDFGSNLFTAENADESYSIRQVNYTSCSGLPEHVFARATDATNGDGTVSWSLAPGRQRCPQFGLNSYVLEAISEDLRRTLTLSRSDQEFEVVQPGAMGTLHDVWLIMPCVGSDGAGQTMSFQLTFTASF
jgi:hypothetical protein